MKTNKSNKRYERFRQWQAQPFDYEFTTNEIQHCNNCGHDFTGNFCPHCSQKAGEGPIGWDSVRQSVMDVWGLGSRSLPNTVWQLLLRPGYLISDYISGKRQVSFPPVKMLFIVAVIVVFWAYYLLPLFLGETFNVFGWTTDMFIGLNEWIKDHFVWTYFIISLLYIVPIWILFRHSPRHTRHTLPQGFFIQIFLLVLLLIVSFIALTPIIFIGFNYYLIACIFVIIIYHTIAYKQLFGYGVWGTLWRLLFVLGSTAYLMSFLACLVFDLDFSALGEYSQPTKFSKYYLAGVSASWALLILAIGWGINLIATKITRKRKIG